MEISVLNMSENVQAVNQFYDEIAIAFTYLIHRENLSPKQSNTFFKAIQEEELPMVKMTKQFALHLIDNFDEEVKNKLVSLEEGSIPILENEALVDFIELEMVDAATTFRQWEYGKYAIDFFLNQIIENNTLKIADQQPNDNGVLVEEFVENLAKKNKALDKHEMLFLIQALRTKILLSSPKIASYNLIGSIVQRNLLGMSLRMAVLKSAFEESLPLTIKNRNRKGPKL